MGACRNILLGALVIAIAFSYQAYRDLTKEHPKPEVGECAKIFLDFFEVYLKLHCM